MSHKIHYILFLLFSVIAYGQVTLFTAVENKEYRVNEKIKIRFILRIEGNDLVQESRLRLPDFSKFNVIGSGSETDSYLDPVDKIVINQQVSQWIVEPKAAGKVRIGSALVDVNGKTYKTEPIDIFINEGVAKEKSLAAEDDIYLNMEVENRNIYENQPTIAIIRAFSKNFNNLRNVGEIRFTDQKDVEIKPISYHKSDIEQNEKSLMLSQVVATVLLYPAKTGAVEVKPATALYNNGVKSTKLKTNKVSLNVKHLPFGSPKSFKNAVGKYKMAITRAEPSARVEVNKPINILVKISGEGNLNESDLPKLEGSESYIYYKPKTEKKLHNTREGQKGQFQASYIVIPKVAGNIKINTEKFSFFNPETKRYTDLSEQSLDLQVLTPEEVSDNKTALEKVNEYTNNVLETVSSPVMETKKLKVEPQAKLNWKTLITNYLLIGLFSVVLLIIGWFVRKNLYPKPNSVELGSVKETENALRNSFNFDSESHFAYLYKLSAEKNYPAFFENFIQMKEEAEQFVQQKYELEIKPYFEKFHGAKAAEDYQAIIQQFQIEKYSPVHTQEQLESLLDKAKVLFILIK